MSFIRLVSIRINHGRDGCFEIKAFGSLIEKGLIPPTSRIWMLMPEKVRPGAMWS
jgi:hypothetical protein